jgi:hypothetical protein
MPLKIKKTVNKADNPFPFYCFLLHLLKDIPFALRFDVFFIGMHGRGL